MIDATELTKKFGDKVAVDHLSFSVRPGMVTGFLGPNGAGKSTTMRLILGLDHATSGRSRVNGRSYVSAKAPMTEVGALLEAKSVHPGRTARNHLRALAATHGISTKRVDEMIELVGLTAVARQRAGGYSLGMSQRLGLAAALLGDPETLILDEPINGLDPEGVAWVRNLVKHLASQGRTVFISSHLMSEMALTADHVIIIGRGRLIADSPMGDLIAKASGVVTKVRSPNASEIADAATSAGWSAKLGDDGSLTITGLSCQVVGDEAARRGWVLHELTPLQRSLEDVYMELTDSAQEFHAGTAPDLLPAGRPVAEVPASLPPVAEPEPVRPAVPVPVAPAAPAAPVSALPATADPPVPPEPAPVQPDPRPADRPPLGDWSATAPSSVLADRIGPLEEPDWTPPPLPARTDTPLLDSLIAPLSSFAVPSEAPSPVTPPVPPATPTVPPTAPVTPGVSSVVPAVPLPAPPSAPVAPLPPAAPPVWIVPEVPVTEPAVVVPPATKPRPPWPVTGPVYPPPVAQPDPVAPVEAPVSELPDETDRPRRAWVEG